MTRLLTFLWNNCDGSKPLSESQIDVACNRIQMNVLLSPVVVDVVQHLLHALPLCRCQMRAITLRSFCRGHGRGARAPVALLGEYHVGCMALWQRAHAMRQCWRCFLHTSQWLGLNVGARRALGAKFEPLLLWTSAPSLNEALRIRPCPCAFSEASRGCGPLSQALSPCLRCGHAFTY
jgi:hypothetical protein